MKFVDFTLGIATLVFNARTSLSMLRGYFEGEPVARGDGLVGVILVVSAIAGLRLALVSL